MERNLEAIQAQVINRQNEFFVDKIAAHNQTEDQLPYLDRWCGYESKDHFFELPFNLALYFNSRLINRRK